ncbi:perlucin-like isoform X2 [Mercenaria mercenaria]|uniref:perlucin-like isoform X2 n=1 Tax=Mercenaria mercenaria TaxID=6596 RepID=UPI00234E424C|nr:perlucin-like isoform X2 [Mercenaria mercenaria]
MQITYLSLALYFLFIYAGFDGAFAGTNFKYIRSGDLEGHTCPADQTIFEDKGSVAQCLSMCSEISTCFGVFRQPQNSHCLGCKDRFLTSDKAPLLNGTQYYRRQTYRFVEEGKTWYEAKNYCEKLGGRLADIQTIEEEKFIEGNVISDDKEIWLGATDEENEGTFLWQDGTKVSDAYDNWGPNQPNGVNFGAVAHCMQFWFEGGKWTWNDAACSKYIPSVCEFY